MKSLFLYCSIFEASGNDDNRRGLESSCEITMYVNTPTESSSFCIIAMHSSNKYIDFLGYPSAALNTKVSAVCTACLFLFSKNV